MEKHEFDKLVRSTAIKMLQKKLLIFSLSSVALAGTILAVSTRRLLNSISTDEDWSQADWTIDATEEEIELD